jgi:hypothetical protein
VTRRLPLRALLRSRGIISTATASSFVTEAFFFNGYEARVFREGRCGKWETVAYINAPTRRAALAGLRAVVEAMPEKRKARRHV